MVGAMAGRSAEVTAGGWAFHVVAALTAFGLAVGALAPLDMAHAAPRQQLAPKSAPEPALAPWHKPRSGAPVGKPPGTTKPSSAKSAPADPPTQSQAPPAEAPPPVDEWSTVEVSAELKSCIERLAAIQARVEIAEPFKTGECGAPAAVEVRRIGTRYPLEISPPATLRCDMAVALYKFVEESLQPAAVDLLGAPVARIDGISSYSCRNRYGAKTGRLSEHALANALDVPNFRLANGNDVRVLKEWGPTRRDLDVDGMIVADPAGPAKPTPVAITGYRASNRPPAERVAATPPVPIKKSDAVMDRGKNGPSNGAGKPKPPEAKPKNAAQPTPPARLKPPPPTKAALFLKRVHKEACGFFGTVLGPEANEAHRDHFHFDMAARRRSNYCE